MAGEDLRLKFLADLELTQGRLSKQLSKLEASFTKAVNSGTKRGLAKLDVTDFQKRLTAVMRASLTDAQKGAISQLAGGKKFTELSKRDQGTATRGFAALRLQSERQSELATLLSREGFPAQAKALRTERDKTLQQLKAINKQMDPLALEAARQAKLARETTAAQKALKTDNEKLARVNKKAFESAQKMEEGYRKAATDAQKALKTDNEKLARVNKKAFESAQKMEEGYRKAATDAQKALKTDNEKLARANKRSVESAQKMEEGYRKAAAAVAKQNAANLSVSSLRAREVRLEAKPALQALGAKSTIGLDAAAVKNLRDTGPLIRLARTELGLLAIAADKTAKNYKSTSAEIERANAAVTRQLRVVDQLKARQKELNAIRKQQAKDAVIAAREETKLAKEQERSARATANAVTPVNQLTKAHKDLNKPLGQGTLLLRQFFRFAVGYAALFRVLGVLRDLVKGVVELDKELISLQAITRANAAEMGTIETAIKRVATTTKFSTGEIVKAARVLGQAGVEIANIPSALAATADFAAATDSSLETAADLVTTYRNVFKELSDTKIADQLTKAINISKLTADDLKSILSLSSQIAQSYNLTSEQYLAAVTTLRNAGIKASTVATGLRQALSEIFSPNDNTIKKLRERYRQIGEFISRDAVKQKFFGFSRADNPLLAALRELDRLGFTGQGQKTLGRVFNVRATNAISALVKNMENLVEAEAKITFGRGSAEAAEIQMRSLSNSVDNLFAAMTVFSDQVGGPAVRALESLADGATNAVLELNKLDQQLRSTGKEGLAGSLLPALFGGVAGGLAGKGIKQRLIGGAVGTVAGGAAGISGQEGGFGGGDLATLAALTGIGGALGLQAKKAIPEKLPSLGTKGVLDLSGKGLKGITKRGISRLVAFIPVIGPVIGMFLILFDIADLLLDIDLPASAVEEASRKAEAARERLETSQQELASLQTFVDEFDLTLDSPDPGTAADSFAKLRKQFNDLAKKDTPLLRSEVDARLRGIASELSIKIEKASDAVRQALSDDVDLKDVENLPPELKKALNLSRLRFDIPGLEDVLDGTSEITSEARFEILSTAVQFLSDSFKEDMEAVQRQVATRLSDSVDASIKEALEKGVDGNVDVLLRSLSNAYQGISDETEKGLEEYIKRLAENIDTAKSVAIKGALKRLNLSAVGRPGAFSRAPAKRFGEDLKAAEGVAVPLEAEKVKAEKQLSKVKATKKRILEEAVLSNLGLIEQAQEQFLTDPDFREFLETSPDSTAASLFKAFSDPRALEELKQAATEVFFKGEKAVTAAYDGVSNAFGEISTIYDGFVATREGVEQSLRGLEEFKKFRVTAKEELDIAKLEAGIDALKQSGQIDELLEGALESEKNLYTQLQTLLLERQKKAVDKANKELGDAFSSDDIAKIDNPKSQKEYQDLKDALDKAEAELAKIPVTLRKQVDFLRSSAADAQAAQARRLAELKKTSAELLIEEASSQGDIQKFSDGMALLAAANLEAIDAMQAELNRKNLLDDALKEEIDARKRLVGELGITSAQMAKELDKFVNDNLARIQRQIDRPITTGDAKKDADFNRAGAYTREAQARKLEEEGRLLKEQAKLLTESLAQAEHDLAIFKDANPGEKTGDFVESIVKYKEELQDLAVTQAENEIALRGFTDGLAEATRRTLDLDTLLAKFENSAITFDDLGDAIQDHFVDGLDAVGESLAQAALSGDSLADTFRDLIGAVAQEIFTDTVKGFVNEGIAKILKKAKGGEEAGSAGGSLIEKAKAAYTPGPTDTPGIVPGKSQGFFGAFTQGIANFGSKVTDFLGGINLFGFSVGDMLSGLGGLIKGLLGSFSGGGSGGGLLASIASFASGIFGAKDGGLLTQAKKFGSGGLISGAGSTTSDSIPGVVINSDGTKSPVLLSDKEAVLNAKAVEVLGKDFIHAINSGQLGRFNQGGLTASAARMTSSAKPSTANRGMDAALVNQLVGAIEKVKLNANITNLLDKREVAKSALSTTEGERGVLNIIRNNRQSIKQDLS